MNFSSKEKSLFLISIAQFSWLTVLAPTLSTAVAGHDATYILAAHFLFSGLGFLLASRGSSTVDSALARRLFPLGLLGSMLLVKLSIESVELTAKPFSGFSGAGYENLGLSLLAFSQLCIAVGLSSLFYSFAFGRMLRESSVVRIYGIELLAAVTGTLATVVILEMGSWVGVARFVLTALFAAVVCEVGSFPNLTSNLIRKVSIALGVLILSWCAGSYFEPQVNLHLSARDFSLKFSVTELSRSWNMYSKVQRLHVENSRETRELISIGDGLGHARADSHSSNEVATEIRLAASLRPRNVLILFAGAGAEIHAYRTAHPAVETIVGVELNPRVAELNERAFHPGDELVVKDARVYLEENSRRFEQIVFSWSGTSAIQHAGVVLQTTSYAYTAEALRAALNRLKPGGTIFFFGGPIYQFINFFTQDLGVQFVNSVMIFQPIGFFEMGQGWDRRILAVKNGTFNPADVHAVETAGRNAYQREFPTDPLLMRGRKSYIVEFLDGLAQDSFHPQSIRVGGQTDVRTAIRTDDDPFVFNNRASTAFAVSRLLTKSELVFVVALVLALLTALGSSHSTSGLMRIYFVGLALLAGLGFAATKAFALYKGSLVLGNPTAALSLTITASLVGQYLSCIRFSRRNLLNGHTFKSAGIVGVLLWITFGILMRTQSEVIFSVPVWIRASWILLHTGAATYFSSLLFLQLIEAGGLKFGRVFVTSLFAIDSIASGLMMILTPTLVSSIGISNVLAGAAGALLVLSLWSYLRRLPAASPSIK